MKNPIKYKLFGMSALFIFGAIPCVANAFTAIAWSQSGQRGGSVKNAPTKDAAISAAIADCKKNGGGTDCQVFKVSDEPGFVALYATCAKTCGVSAVTGRPTAEQARADGKRECETYYRASCQLAQEWEEAAPRTSAMPIANNQQTQNSYKTSADLSINNNLHVNKKEWKFSKVGLYGKVWYLPSSVKRNGSIIKVTTMTHFDEPLMSVIPGTPIYYAVYEHLFNCKTEGDATTSRAFYSSYPDGHPDKLEQQAPGATHADPNSPISNVWKDVCGKAISGVPLRASPDLRHSNGHREQGNHEREFMEEQRRELRNECLNTGSCGGFDRFNDRQLY